MKRVALDLGASHGGVQEIQIEKRVVPHQNRARAIRGPYGVADFAKYALAARLPRDRRPQGVMGSIPFTASDAASMLAPGNGLT